MIWCSVIKASFQDSNATTITMSETWLNEMYDKTYNMIVNIRQDRIWDNNKKGGGICIYVRSGIVFSD